MRRRHEQYAFAGSLHFVTVVTLERGAWFKTASECEAILQWFENFRAKYDLICRGYVLMPDHLHALLRQELDGNPVSDAVGGFKRMTSLRVKPDAYPKKLSLWRPTYDDVLVPGLNAAHTKLNYMHQNPVKKGLVERSEDWNWSSAGFYFYERPGIVEVEPLGHQIK